MRSLLHRSAEAFRRRSSGALWPWLAPLAVAGFLYLSPLGRVQDALGVLIGVVVILLASRRPDRALLLLVALLPFSTLLLALLYRLGVPEGLVRPLGAWKEALLLGVVLAAIRDFHRSGRRFDNLDWLAAGFIALAGLYAIAAPAVLSTAPGGVAARVLGFRQTAGFVILLLAARHVSLPPGFASRAMRVVLAAGIGVALVGVFEFFLSPVWNALLVQGLNLPKYQLFVLKTPPVNAADYRIHGYIGNRSILRIGSVFLSAPACGFYLVIAFAAAIEGVLRRGARVTVLLALGLIGAALILTQTRSAIVAALLVAFLAFRPAAGRGRHQRLRFALVLAAVAVLAIPAASATGLVQRTAGAATGEDASTGFHIRALAQGAGVIATHPLGRGLGTAAGIGQRIERAQAVVSENTYVQVGNELGIPAMLLFIAFTISAVRHLRTATRRLDYPLAAAMFGALSGLAVGAFFLFPWNEFAVAYTVWGLGGASLSLARARAGAPAASQERAEHAPAVRSGWQPPARRLAPGTRPPG